MTEHISLAKVHEAAGGTVDEGTIQALMRTTQYQELQALAASVLWQPYYEY